MEKEKEHNIRYEKEVPCSLCDKVALKVGTGEDLAGRLAIFVKDSGLSLYISDRSEIAQIQELLDQENWERVYRMNREYMQGYCRECNRMYCNDHWLKIPTFDDGYFDTLVGWCPEDHYQKIAD